MTPSDLILYYGNSYKFKKRTGMSDVSFRNWCKWGKIPEYSQLKLEKITKGELKAEWSGHD